MKHIILNYIFLFVLAGCSSLFGDPPEISYSIQGKIDNQPGSFTKFIVKLSNESDADAYNISETISLYRGNTVIENGYLSISKILKKESAPDEAWFPKIDSHQSYDRYKVELSWSDNRGNYYYK